MSELNYIAILGRQPELGLVELESLLGGANVQPYGRQAALISEPVPVDRLGGSVKIARVLTRQSAFGLQDLPVDTAELPRREGKTPFALSLYGLRETPKGLLAAGLSLKKRLREYGSVRLVTPARGLAVSAAELRHNHVLEEGFELLAVAADGEMILAQTLGVQDIDWYTRRDYERPARSAKVGMLPPKLAQVLVNTTHSRTIHDPFCGTGVVLQEALLLGRSVSGSDLAENMVMATVENMKWIVDEAGLVPDWRVGEADARQVELALNSAVVSEGYLGPNLMHSPDPSELAKIQKELLALYCDALRNFAAQLESGGEVSICVPAWRMGKRWSYLALVDELGDLGYTLKSFEHVRTPLLYARDDQVVGRQLLLLRKN